MPTVKTSREEVLTKAALIIRQNGYTNTSMDMLAKACDVKPSLFYYYFKNKEDLMTAVLQFVLDSFRERVAIYADDNSLSPSEKIEKVLKRMAKVFMYGEGGCIMGNTILESAHMEPQFLDITKQFFDEFAGTLAKIYEAKYSKEIARSLAEQVIQDAEGGVMMSRLYKDEKYMMNALQRAKNHLS